jgi:hypothetical protein
MRMLDQTFAGETASLLVVVKPCAQRARVQRCVGQRLHQSLGVLAVGARQRGHHPVRGPARQSALDHRNKNRVRKSRKQLRSSADPADIAPAASGDRVLRQPQALHQFTNQLRFFDRRPLAALRPRQDAEHRLGQIARPAFDPRRVAAEPAQRGDAPIAVDQNQRLPALQNLDRRIGHRNARDNLAAALDRARNPLDRQRFRYTRTGKAQIQAVQIEIQPLRVHGRHS